MTSNHRQKTLIKYINALFLFFLQISRNIPYSSHEERSHFIWCIWPVHEHGTVVRLAGHTRSPRRLEWRHRKPIGVNDPRWIVYLCHLWKHHAHRLKLLFDLRCPATVRHWTRGTWMQNSFNVVAIKCFHRTILCKAANADNFRWL